jgi:hypothetical protein
MSKFDLYANLRTLYKVAYETLIPDASEFKNDRTGLKLDSIILTD